MDRQPPTPRGRGSHLNPPNRFGGPHHLPDLEQLAHDPDAREALLNVEKHAAAQSVVVTVFALHPPRWSF